MTHDPTPQDLDFSGLSCPLPVLRLRKALQGATAGAVFRVRATDPMAKIDIPHLCQQTGDQCDGPHGDGDGWLFFVTCRAD